MPSSSIPLGPKQGRGRGGRRRPWAKAEAGRRGKARGRHGDSIPLLTSSGDGARRPGHGGGRRSPEMVVVAALRAWGGGLEVAGELVVLDGCARAYL